MEKIMNEVKEEFEKLGNSNNLMDYEVLTKRAENVRKFFIMLAALAIKRVEVIDNEADVNAKRGRSISI